MTSGLKVLRISHSSGVSAYRERDRQLVAKHGIDVRLVIPEHWEHIGGDSAEPQESFAVVKAKTCGTGSIPLFFYDPMRIVQQLKEFKPDLVDIHEEPYSVSCYEITKLVQHFSPQAAVVFYSAQNIKKSYPPPFSWTEQYIYHHTNGAYPCSDGVKEVLQQKGFKKHCDVIPLGVDTEMFHPNQTCSKNGKVTVGYFGRIEEYKGVDTIVEALSKLRENPDWKLLLVGNGSFTATLNELANGLNVSDRIESVGEVRADEIPEYLNKCDVVVVPSKTTKTWKEQFGRAVTEAMACRVPVVASDSGSLPEVVGDAGFIFPEQNSEALSQALRQLIESPEKRVEFGKRSLERVLTLYTWETVAKKMCELYEIALQEKRTRPSRN